MALTYASSSPLPYHKRTVFDQDYNVEEGFNDEHWLSHYSYQPKYFTFIQLTICLVGWLGNAVIIRTFLKIGLKDTSTIVLFNISVSDINFINTMFVMCVCQLSEYAPENAFYNFKVHPYSIEMMCQFSIDIFMQITLYSTTFVAIQRCLCVLKPLKFNGMFTRFRTFAIVAVIWVISIPIYFIEIQWRRLTQEILPNNNTWLTVVTAQLSKSMVFINYTNIVLGVIHGFCQCIVVVCVFIMKRELKKSVQFREVATTKSSSQEGGQPGCSTDDVTESKTKNKTVSTKMDNAGYKERRVTIQVSLVAAIFLLTNFHRLIYAIVTEVPGFWEFFYHGDMWQYFMMYWYVNFTLLLTNASVNFFIYYNYNTKFRQLCFTW